MTEKRQADVICLGVPEASEGLPQEDFLKELNGIAVKTIRGQWDKHARIVLRDIEIDWLVTSSLPDVNEFLPIHDCEQCGEAVTRAREYLNNHPGRKVALGNLQYTEVWPDYDLPESLEEWEREFLTGLLNMDDRVTVEVALELLEITKVKAAEARKQSVTWKKI